MHDKDTYSFEATHFGFFFSANACRPIIKFSPDMRASWYFSAVSWEALSTLPVSQDSLKPARVTMIASGE